ncbi:MAG: bifunctional diaminohydroxyphosphoribosylaminopyrimidine deaminase/5-amino-6-(5-phosphoribosylamino)uracil reductase RibD [Dermatophilaceae bacterium]|nr:bifunctional diaminohydroxyphosphoribosylaminopyrimidine deaminase/5-amino-6-(5-phosphoribosylamino)uracil reductase RibD [Intrasporangiaceae bacterium]
MSTDPVDERHMRRAIEAALQGPENDPNPRVGCVLADGEREVAVGHHRGAGTPHAEIDALEQAGEAANGTTAYVTLEPCHHTGRTGPCTLALREAGVSRVVYAVADPNPNATGGGRWLAEQDITVESGVLEAEAERVTASWLHLMRTGRPWVVWKFATTLDGRSAAADGTSQWITGPAARRDVHAARSRCGAVVVGTGTVLADDPRLTVRDEQDRAADRQPLRVVVGERDLAPTAQVLDDAAETVHLRTRDPRAVLEALGSWQIHRVWLEGGPTLAAAFLRDRCVDEVIAWIAPALLGAGRPSVADLGITAISDALRLEIEDVTVMGGDIRVTARPVPHATPHPDTDPGRS